MEDFERCFERNYGDVARFCARRARLTERLRRQPLPAHVEPLGLAQALSALPAADRELLLLTGWEGLTPAEIGRVLQRPAALVSRRLYRARRRLAAELGGGTPTPVESK
jgi:RNA polymerase sigma-70 factor (ECF subfamily)